MNIFVIIVEMDQNTDKISTEIIEKRTHVVAENIDQVWDYAQKILMPECERLISVTDLNISVSVLV